MMPARREFRFKIEGGSPETMPMKRLAEYVSELAVLFGEEDRVHLVAIERQSTCPVILVDQDAEFKIANRIETAKSKKGPEEPINAMDRLRSKLLEDGRSALLLNPSNVKLIEFQPSQFPKPIEWPSINQQSELYGVPIAIGGKNDPVPVHLLDGDNEYNLLAERSKAKGIAAHLFTSVLRVSGRGRWRRLPSGKWNLERFIIDYFEPLKTVTIKGALDELREIKGRWKETDDPMATLNDIRMGKEEECDGGIR